MTKRDKTLERWLTAKDESFETVHNVLLHEGFAVRSVKGSHTTYENAFLKKAYEANRKGLAEFGPDGLLTIPKLGGQKVKSFYLLLALKAIALIRKAKEVAENG